MMLMNKKQIKMIVENQYQNEDIFLKIKWKNNLNMLPMSMNIEYR